LPELERAQYPVRIAKFAVGLVRREIDEHKRHVAYLNKKIAGAEERMRVAKIFQAVSGTGHTLQSWCASVNQPDILELLFEHGAVPGFTDEVQLLSATILQLLWRNFWWLGHRGPFAPSLAAGWREKSLRHQMAMAAALQRLRHLRLRTRLPLVEAMYNGHHRILNVFTRKKIPMFQGARSWVKPLPVPPFVTPPAPPKPKTPEDGGKVITPAMLLGENADPDVLAAAEAAAAEEAVAKALEKEQQHATIKSPPGVVDMLMAAQQGAKERQCDDYVVGFGWVPHHHDQSNWSLCLAACAKHWAATAKHCEDGKKEAQRRRRLRDATKELRELEVKLERLLTESTVMDWAEIMSCITNGAACDYESAEGFTPLIRAAEEDTDRLYFQPALNADQHPVLAVELLLDRPTKRPQVDKENRLGHTALSWAGLKDRQAQMECLVKRGANVNFISTKHHRTALIWCAMVGKQRSVRFLLESGADQEVKDHTGRKAVDWATEGEHAETLSVLLQFRQGNLGLVIKRRGAAIEQVPCCWGCGLITTRPQLVEHEANECPKRSVRCRNPGCHVELLQAWEQVQHEAELCPQRSIDCPLGCGQRLRLSLMGAHVDGDCPMRTVDCEFGCGATMRLKDRASKHNAFECPNRLAECKLMCHSTLRHRDVRDHEKNQCPCRIVGCRVGCGLSMMARVRDEHEESSCDARIVKCRNKCKVEDLKARDRDAHERDLCVKRLVPCPNKCADPKIQCRALDSHIANKCPKRFVKCPEKCGKAVRFEALASHVKQECERRLVDCPLQCGVMPRLQARMVEVHCRGECANRVVVCAMCGEGVPSAKLEGHKDSSCPMRVVECEHRGCYKRLPLSEMPQHCDYECRKRQVYCLQGCGMAMYADKRKGHHEKQCPMRYVPCPLGCAKPIREQEKASHITKDCVRRAGAR
jgi:ankyrin repeat protein